jgi:hypothetical protein
MIVRGGCHSLEGFGKASSDGSSRPRDWFHGASTFKLCSGTMVKIRNSDPDSNLHKRGGATEFSSLLTAV